MLLLMAGGFAAVVALTGRPSSAPPPLAPSSSAVAVVPWIAAPASPTPTPDPWPAISPARRACGAEDLTVSVELQGATAMVAGGPSFRNRSQTACTLQGRPQIQMIDSRGMVVPIREKPGRSSFVLSDYPPPPGWPVVTVPPGRRAFSFAIWDNWCRGAGPLSWRVTLPNLGTFSVPITDIRPRCGSASAGSFLSVGPVEPLPLNPKYPPSRRVAVTIRPPSTIHPGKQLRYLVTLTNEGKSTWVLDPCPNYTESLLGGPGSDRQVEQTYALNCAAIGSIGPGQSSAFAMVLDVPASATPGSRVLTWFLGFGYEPGGEKLPVTIVEP